MRYLFDKVQRLKEIHPEDELTKREKAILTKYNPKLSRFLDRNDHHYKELKTFIEGSKKTYVQHLHTK